MYGILRPRAVLAALAALASLVVAPSALANHPVYVEGNCFGPGLAQRTLVTPGTCGDYDGDGRIGTVEDFDEADRVFGTISAALGAGSGIAVGTGANQNGSVTIVASGVFPESVIITAANGNVTLQGAPGVEADIDAVVMGEPGSGARVSAPGVIVNAPANRRVTIRNIMSRNWTSGYQVVGASHVTLDGVRAENNVNFGVEVKDNARVAISNSAVQATGARVGVGGDFPGTSTPMPGTGVDFSGASSGTVCFSTVTGSFRAGIADRSTGDVLASHDNVFDNQPDLSNVELAADCVQPRRMGGDDDNDDVVLPLPHGTGPLPLALLITGLAGLALAASRRGLRPSRA